MVRRENATLADLAGALRSRLGRPSVVVTRGEQGAYLLDGSGGRSFPAPSVTAVDTIAAGDTFCGNLAARLALRSSLDEAVRFAVVAATLSVTRQGAALAAPRADEVLATLAPDGARVAAVRP